MMWTIFKGMNRLSRASLLAVLVAISALYSSVIFAAELKVVVSGEAPIYKDTLLALIQNAPSGIAIKSYSLSEWDTEGAEPLLPASPTLPVIAIGSKATIKLLQQSQEQSVLSILTPSSTFSEWIKNNPRLAVKITEGKLAAIFMDQPARRQINLARLIAPKMQSMGTLYEERSQQLVVQLNSAAEANQINFKAKLLMPKDNPIVALRELYKDIDLFVAIPGRYIFNQSTAKWMLYLSYKYHKPLLGFSTAYVEAGALAAVHTTAEEISRQAMELIEEYQQVKKLPSSAVYPKYFSIKTNREVAEQLNITLDSDAVLELKLRNLELVE